MATAEFAFGVFFVAGALRGFLGLDLGCRGGFGFGCRRGSSRNCRWCVGGRRWRFRSGIAHSIRSLSFVFASLCFFASASNPIAAENHTARSAFSCRRRQAPPPIRREKRLDEAAGGYGQFFGVAEPPGLGNSRQAVRINVFYLNHFEQSKPGVSVAPTARSRTAVRRFGDSVIA